MKTLLIASMILSASLAFGGEITKEELIKTYENYKTNFQEVTPGMTAEYHSVDLTFNDQGEKFECNHHVKEVVISNEQKDKFLVYVKSTALNDCPEENKGEVDEYLDMRNLQTPEQYFTGVGVEIEPVKISFDGRMVEMVGSITFTEGEEDRFEITLDITKSQFYAATRTKLDFMNTQTSLLRRGYTDPEIIDLTNLEVVE